MSFSRRQKDKNPKIERKPLPVQGLNFAAPDGTEFGRTVKANDPGWNFSILGNAILQP
jgi:hypothetical protein